MMIWEEITDVLISFGEKVHVIRGDTADTVSLQLVPAGWLVSMKASGVLNIGKYEGEDHRLVGTRVIPFAELTPELLRQEVQKIMTEQILLILAFDATHNQLDAGKRKRHRRF